MSIPYAFYETRTHNAMALQKFSMLSSGMACTA